MNCDGFRNDTIVLYKTFVIISIDLTLFAESFARNPSTFFSFAYEYSLSQHIGLTFNLTINISSNWKRSSAIHIYCIYNFSIVLSDFAKV